MVRGTRVSKGKAGGLVAKGTRHAEHGTDLAR